MNLSAEISLYPLQENYIPIVKAFIERLNQYTDLTLETNIMSTQIHGAYDRVMQVIKEELQNSFREFGVSILVVKFIPRAGLDVNQ